MANESSYSGISGLVASVYDIAFMTAQEGNVIQPFITTLTNSNSAAPRIFGNYSGGTFLAVAETADSSQQAFNATAGGTLTPAVYASMALLTNRRITSDPANAVQEAGQYLGETAAAFVDTTLAGLFSSLTGGTVGTAGGTATWANILRASAYLRANKVSGAYTCILRPEQWYYLTSATSGVPTLMTIAAFKESPLGSFYQASFSGINFFVDANITSGTAAVGAMFAPQAIALDLRQPFQIEPQYNASYSGNGAWELNASIMMAAGVYRPTFGCQIIGTSA